MKLKDSIRACTFFFNMKIIPGLRKSLTKEFGQARVHGFLQSILHLSTPSIPIIQEYTMMLEKPRVAARYTPEHQLMHALIAEKLDSALLPIYSPELISYQKGKTLDDVFSELKIFLSAYKKSCPDKKKRILGVVKWDIKSYGESIPLHESSQLWQQLKRAGQEELIPWIKSELRAVIDDEKIADGPASLMRGISFGMPSTPPLLNLYLSDFDRDLLKEFPHIFYRRFGDDCIVVTKDISEVSVINEWVVHELAKYELKQNKEKSKSYQWTATGFNSSARIEFLGRSVNFNGQMHLTSAKQTELIYQWKRLMRKIKAVDESYLLSSWDAFVKSTHCEELFSWTNDSDSVKNLSDRLGELTRKNFNLKEHKGFVPLYKKWHHK